MPEVSVVIPNYNQTRYLGEAIESVLAQTFRAFEIIVVDDGSTEDCAELVNRYGAVVRYIRQENRGLAGARNTGIRNATGRLIGLLDADDAWRPTFLARMVALAEAYPDAAVYYSAARGMDEDSVDLPRIFGQAVGETEDMYATLLRANYLIPSTVVLRRAIVDAVGLFDEQCRAIHGCEDWDLWLQLAPRYAFHGVVEPLVRYRIHGASMSANPESMQRSLAAVMEKNFGPDDGQWQTWSPDKRRAYGGLYRFIIVTSVQRRNDWGAGTRHLRKALAIDPSLACDIDMFYELAFGSQPTGLRGTAESVDLASNADALIGMLASAFALPLAPGEDDLYQQARGTAYYAAGLAAYNTGELGLSRGYLSRALRCRPKLWRDARLRGDLVKSFAGKRIRRWLHPQPGRIGSGT